jgi:hypothetical protein
MQVNTYGGTGSYILLVDDAEPPSRYEGTGPFFHTILSGRCNAWVNTITVQDAGSGQVISEATWVDPHQLFEGGCLVQ